MDRWIMIPMMSSATAPGRRSGVRKPRRGPFRRAGASRGPVWRRALRWVFGFGGGAVVLSLLLFVVMLVRWRVLQPASFEATFGRLL